YPWGASLRCVRPPVSRDRAHRRRGLHPDHPQRRPDPRSQEGLLPPRGGSAPCPVGDPERRCVDQPDRGKEGKLVLRQRHRPVRTDAIAAPRYKLPLAPPPPEAPPPKPPNPPPPEN